MATTSKCGYCSPCFTLSGLEATVDSPDRDQIERIRREGTEFWRLSYSLCLKNVKCISKLFPTQVRLFPDPKGTGPAYSYILTNNEICLTGEDLSTYSPKVCCRIGGIHGVNECCTVLQETIKDDPVRPTCKDGNTFFEVKTSSIGGASLFEVQRALYDHIPFIVHLEWNRLINDFPVRSDLRDPLADLYRSTTWRRCLNCPDGC